MTHSFVFFAREINGFFVRLYSTVSNSVAMVVALNKRVVLTLVWAGGEEDVEHLERTEQIFLEMIYRPYCFSKSNG